MKKSLEYVVFLIIILATPMLSVACVGSDDIATISTEEHHFYTGFDESNILEEEPLTDIEETNKSKDDIYSGDDVIAHQIDDKVIMRIGFWDSRMDVYYFTVSRNGLLEASRGTTWMPGHEFQDDLIDMLSDVDEIGTKQLRQSDFDHIMEMADEIQKNNYGQELNFGYAFGFGAWTIYLNYNDMFFALKYSNVSPEVVNCFIEQLFMLSPIQTPEFWEGRYGTILETGLAVYRWNYS